MAEEYSTTATAQDGTVTMVEDGDALTAASVRVGMEEGSDAVERLQELVNPGESDSGTQTFTRVCNQTPIIFQNCVVTADVNLGLFTPCVYVASGYTLEANRAKFFYPLDLPDGALLTQVTVTVDPDSNVGLPDGELPKIEVYEVDIATGVRTSIGSQIDPTAVEATYEAIHTWTCSLDSGGRTVNRQTKGYHALVLGEWGSNCTGGGTTFYGCTYGLAVDVIDPAAG